MAIQQQQENGRLRHRADDQEQLRSRNSSGQCSAPASDELALRKKIEELQEEKDRYERIFSDALSGIFQAEPNGGILVANPAMITLCGYPSRDEFMAISDIGRQLFADPAEKDALVKTLREEQTAIGFEAWLKKYDRTLIEVSLNASLQTSAGGEYLECFVQDITDRKQTEQELREDKQFLQNVFDSIQDGISVLDPTLTITQVNRWIERVHHDEMPLIGKKCYAAYQKKTSPCPWCPSTRALATGKVRVEEVRVPRSDGAFWWCELSAYPLKDDRDQITGVIEHVKDITDRKQAEEALWESERRYRELFENSRDGFVVIDTEARFMDANQAYCDMLGYTLEELKQKTDFYEITPARWRVWEQHEIWEKRLLQEGYSGIYEKEYIRKDGTVFPVELQSYTVFNKHGRPRYLWGIARDITERKRTEEALRNSEKRLIEAQHLAKMGDFTWNVETGEITWSDALFDLLRYDKSENLDYATVNARIHHPDDLERVTQWLNESIASGQTELPPNEYRLIRKDRTVLYVRTIGIIQRQEGQPVTVFATIQDITERKLSEEALRESEERFRSIFENATIGLYRTTPDGQILMANPTLVQMLGYTSFEELAQRNLNQEGFEAYYPRSVFQHYVESEGKVFGLESAWVRRDGTTVFIRESARVVRDTFGKTLYYEGTVEDITARKRAEKALSESEEKYRTYVENAPEGIFITNAEGQYIDVNEAACRMTGYSRDELLRMKIFDLAPPQAPPEAFESFTTLREAGSVESEIIIRTKDGSDIYALLSAVALGRDRYMGFCSDITGPKQAEAALRESEARFNAFMENLPAVVFIKDADGRFLYVNPYLERTFDLQDWYGKATDDLFPQDIGAAMSADDRKALREGHQVIFEQLPGQDEVLRTYETHKFPIQRNDESVLLGGIALDVTERVRAEEALRRLNAQLEQRVTERTAQLETINSELKDFAYIVSHDLKAPLRGVSHLATWILQDYAEVLDDQGQELLHLLSSRVQRMTRLIEGILEYSRIGRLQGEKQWLNLQTLVHDVIDSLAPPAHIQVSVETPLPNVWGNSTRIMQVFQNLISNAIEYHDKAQGSVIVRCENVGDQWQFNVADNGPGIAEHDYDRIFKIFQTGQRRDEIESTGIGLTVVKKIVELYGGAIWVESEVGVGSTFCFTLPKDGEQSKEER